MRLGARTLKTGIAVVICILIGKMVPAINVANPPWIAVICMQQSIRKTWKTFWQRIAAAVFGGVMAVAMATFFGQSAIVIGTATILFIMIMNLLRMQDVTDAALITLIVIMLSNFSSPAELIQLAFWRVIENVVGVTTAFFVNIFILPPHYDNNLYEEISSTTSEVHIRLRAILRKNGEYASLNSDIKWARKQIRNIKKLYGLACDEFVWNPRRLVARKRRLVVFRSFIAALIKMTDLLEIIHNHTNVLFSMDSDLRHQLREYIETLCSANEQIFLKFDGRISADEVNFFTPSKTSRQTLMEKLFEAARFEGPVSNSKLEQSNALILIAGNLMKVERELIQLNTLVRSYLIHHGEDQVPTDSLTSTDQML